MGLGYIQLAVAHGGLDNAVGYAAVPQPCGWAARDSWLLFTRVNNRVDAGCTACS